MLKQLAVPAEPTGIVEANGAVWASAADGTLSQATQQNGVVSGIGQHASDGADGRGACTLAC